ncbi:hypothetical protein [Massilia genomosp. 1]|uniref:Transposase n=1 Tax=Massilia genomosp. 1 TaxID=2609280 RepID=A0ABX0MK42_9BURK|nr:hypothetical protein [Massilia genomosp. 1]NHZ62412.1 hypothetical protein [Massilia genomosp. 1]
MIAETYPRPELILAVTCSHCSQEASVSVGYGDHAGTLRICEEFHCVHCGQRWHGDDTGFLQPGPRARMLEAFGEWTVSMGRARSTFDAVKVLRAALGLELLAAYALLKHESGIVFSGTVQECEWLTRLLEKAGESPMMNALTPMSESCRNG